MQLRGKNNCEQEDCRNSQAKNYKRWSHSVYKQIFHQKKLKQIERIANMKNVKRAKINIKTIVSTVKNVIVVSIVEKCVLIALKKLIFRLKLFILKNTSFRFVCFFFKSIYLNKI